MGDGTPADQARTRAAARAFCAAAFCLAWVIALPGITQDLTRARMQGLDEQVQEVKSDVLGIAAELSRLEEKLLYPSNTQVAIFVSAGGLESFRLDSIQIQIDGQPVARHIYSFKELEALARGGVQRLYTGNVSTGQHQLHVSIAGKQAGGKDSAATETFSFAKSAEPKLVEITLSGAESGAASIRLGDW